MGTKGEREGVRAAVRGLLEKDRAGGALKDLSAYQQLFPGFWDVVSEEYEALHAGQEDPPSTPLAPTTPGPAVVVADAGLEKEIERVGPYRIVKELGRGGMGVVYLAEDTRIGRKVALKVLAAHFSSSRQLLLRFQREAELAGKLDHPHICTVYEAGEADGTAYMAMRLVEGKPLSEWIGLSKDTKRPSGVVALPPLEEAKPDGKGDSGGPKRDLDRILQLVEKAARALHVAHEKGLIHRDIKPHNIMVTAEGEPVLLDFGLAREEEGEGQQLTQTGSLMGTPAYMSPEQLTAARNRLDRRTDVYSLGATLYECLTLRLPFEAPTLDALYQKILTTDPEDPRRLNHTIPRDLEVVVATALEKNRDRRYQSAEALAEELRRVRILEPILARPVGALERLGRWAQRSPAVAGTSAALFLSLVAGLAVTANLLKAANIEKTAKEKALEQSVRDGKAKEAALAESQRNLRVSRALALAAEAEAALAVDSSRAVLLAREAVRLHESSRTVSTLQEALQQPLEVTILGPPDSSSIRSASLSPDGELVLALAWDGSGRLWRRDGTVLVTFGGPEDKLESAGFSPDGTRIATVHEANGKVSIWNLDGDRLAVLSPAFRFAEFSPDGTKVLTDATNGCACVWNVDGGVAAELKWIGGKSGIAAGRFSRDGKRILTVSGDGIARVWSVSGERLADLGGRELWVNSAEFSPDGTRIVTASNDGSARIWDSTGLEVGVCNGQNSRCLSAVFSPDGTRILTTKEWEPARLWDHAGRELAVFSRNGAGVLSAEFSPDGSSVLTGSMDRTARLWDLEGNEIAVLRGHQERVHRATFSRDGREVLTASHDMTARLWDLASAGAGLLSGPRNSIRSVRFCPSGARATTAHGDGSARIWDAGGRMLAVISSPGKYWRFADFSPDGLRVLTAASFPSEVRLWDLEGREAAILRGDDSQVLAAMFTPRGPRCLTMSFDGFMRLWTFDGTANPVFRGHYRAVEHASFAPDGTRLVTVHDDGKVLLWNATGGEPIEMGGAHKYVGSACFSPDGSRVLGASLFGSNFYLWDAAGELRVTFKTGIPDTPALSGSTGPAVFSPDGSQILTGSYDKLARLWDIDGGLVRVFRGHEGPILQATFSPDGGDVLTTSEDRTVRLWDLSGSEKMVLLGREGAVMCAAFSPDGRRIVTGSGDGIARFWFTGVEDLLSLADSRIPRDFTPEEREKYKDLLGEPARAGK